MPSDLTPDLREQVENTIRFLAVDAVQRANSGHPGAPMGLARAAFLLWDRFLRFDSRDPDWPLRDRFVLSAGHASMLQYALLHLYGYDLSLDDIAKFRQLDSKTPGHPEYGVTPGIEVTTGPLGQGFAHGVGMALAGKLAAAQFGARGEGPGQHGVYGIVSDGDLMEGISSEAASFAGHLGLGNLVYLYDDNKITIDGPTSLTYSEDVRGRFAACGWHVQTVDGMDLDALESAIEAARSETAKPSLVIVRTTIGYGSPGVAGKNKAHGSPLGLEEVAATKKNLGWTAGSELYVPDAVRDYCRARAEVKRGERAQMDARLEDWRLAHPERAEAWDAARMRRMPADLAAVLADGMEGVEKATRQHSSTVLERLAAQVPYMVGGSADLAGSGAPPLVEATGIVGPGAAEGADPFAGRNVYFGIREHAMGAITNGIALDGTFLPYSGTFLIFSDYMRPSIRLAALMGVRSLFVFTHDSIFVGEDGPTHQPIEQLDSLRALPNLEVWRPADGIETAMAYAWILQHRTGGPSMLSLSRQGVAALERGGSFGLEDVWKGAYAVREPDREPDVVLLGTGTEVRLCCDAADKLASHGVAARVVSVPCLERFMEQPESAQLALVPDDGTPIVAVEAGRGESFRGLVGRRGLVYGMDRFGASGPYADLAERFGYTPDALAARVRSHLSKG